ncbi:nucleoporin NUP42-like [Saccostrea cucullata]|uniref:nucleoporin NUP42-like n=1 Tax=Saccostrea cuccullata TaxID=36930 RepID=UPI002ED01E2A
MVVCKFFMQGYCRFGDNCKFEHPRGGNAGYAYSAQRQLFGGGGGGGSRFGGGAGQNPYKWTANDQQRTQNKPVSQQTSPNDLINTLISEVKELEKTKMWPFSCIGFEKDECVPVMYWRERCVPDFEDTSPEELRHLAYEAQKSNNFQGYIDYVQNLQNEVHKKRQMLANPPMRIKQKMLSLIDDYRLRKNRSGNSSTHHSVSLFSNPSPSENSFQSTSFGSDSSQGSFGATGFGATGTFGASGTQGFGTSGSAGGFGASSESTGVFGSSGGFGANSLSSGSFGSSPGFGASPASSGSFGAGGFGTSSFGAQPSAFPNPNPFGGSTVMPLAFGNNTTKSPSMFDNSSTNSPASASSSSGFQSQGTNVFGSSQTVGHNTGASASFQSPQPVSVESNTYTPMDKLTAEELAEFQATHFTLGKIPTKPPPKELCF